MALGAVLAVLVGIGGYAYLNTGALDDTARALAESHRVDVALSALADALLEADVAARGYADTGRSELRDVYASARGALDPALADLGDVGDRGAVARRGVEALVAEHAGWLDGVVARRHGDPVAAEQSRSASRLADVRATIDRMRRGERDRLARLEARWNGRIASAYAVLVVGIVVGVGIFLPVFLRLYREMTEAERAHEALRESEEHFRSLVEGVRDYAIFPVDPEGKITSWNRGAERIAGYAAAEIVGRSVSHLYPPEEVAVGRPSIDLEHATAHGVHESEGYRLRKDGSRFWASTIIGPLYDEEHRVRGFSVAMRDVTERRRVEEALVRSEARYRAVSELTSDYAYAFRVDPTGAVTVEWIAGAFTRITGYTTEEVEQLGGGIALVHPDDIEIALARVRTLIAHRPDTSEFRIRTKTGDVRWIRESARPVWDEEKRLLRVYGAAQDISERKHAEDAARRHQAELAHLLRVATINELAAGLAHEINQPLAAIVSYARGCSRRMRSGSGETAELVRAVDEIAEQAMRADEIVRRLHRFVRKEAPRPEPLAVNDVVRHAVRLVDGEAAERGVGIQLDLASALPATRADAIQIEQVILNLVRNAFEAMAAVPSDRRSLSITTSATAEGNIEVAVRDAGEGIRPESLGEVFTPFFTTKSHGLGMGLAISRSIVEAHGGRIWATATPGGGTTFRFTLRTDDV